jgi:hypothetical protein
VSPSTIAWRSGGVNADEIRPVDDAGDKSGKLLTAAGTTVDNPAASWG